MSGAIAVFVKTPGLSPVKTRLAVKLGQENAEAFHLASSRSVSSVVQALSQLDDITSYYAVAEESALTHDYWQDLPCLWQGEGGLGERMAHIYQTLLAKHDFVILVGADIPQMTAIELLTASNWLPHNEQARLAFAPSVDGGFWLFGGNCKIPHTIWTGVSYSEADTGTQFFNKIEQVGDIKTLVSLRDVDEVEDLISLRDALLNLIDPVPEQQQLLSFLDTLSLENYS
ncbi:MAG: DUF2064 domain-containing protein [Methylomarinum sp.]|nr:DUF2064 domain-containing protein [Methylomarinum sp.]